MTAAFISHLASDLEAFLKFKRSMGHRYERAEFTLRDFDRFAEGTRRTKRALALDKVILGWLAGKDPNRKPKTIQHEVSVIRQFCKYLRRRDPSAFVPEGNWVKHHPPRFVPYILSETEIRALLRIASTLNRTPFRRDLYRALILVLYCTGLRLGEAVRLRIKDVDLDEATLFIVESKGRSRWVPFHNSLTTELLQYVKARRVVAPDNNLHASFFVGCHGRPLTTSAASITLRKMLRQAKLKPPTGRKGPRPYDLRHAYAVARLTQWYRAGVDLHSRLPWLSTYMGHTNILGTEVYLTATPELLALAGHRFSVRFNRVRRTP